MNPDLVATPSWVEVLQEVEVGPVVAGVLPRLHLAVDHARIVTIPVDVVDLRQKSSILERNERASVYTSTCTCTSELSMCTYACVCEYGCVIVLRSF